MLEQIVSFCQDFGKVPVFRKINADIYTPVLLLQKIAAQSDNYYLFESVKEQRWSRYSFLGVNPQTFVQIDDGILTLSDNGNIQKFSNPIDKLKEILNKFKSPKIKGLPVFTGGAVGYFGFESSQYFDKAIKFNNPKPNDLPNVKLMLINNLIVFDHLEQSIYLISNFDSSVEHKAEYKRVLKELDKLEQLIKSQITLPKPCQNTAPVFKSNMSKAQYIENVKKAKDYIIKGDIFQVVPSQKFTSSFEGGLIDIYRNLRTINPSPYLYYIKMDGLEIAGCSPETLVHIVDDSVITYPIAGTIRRGKTEEEDIRLERTLLADEKEVAEHNMLVDLGRNDIGKIAKIGSVKVQNYKKVEKFSHVMHITSQVIGMLREDCHPIDALGAVLPAGTLSGAPKIRAMQIIDELEKEKRGIYGGAICYFGYNGNMDCCIAIRTIIKYKNILSVQVGGGIVLDSNPEDEYTESVNKAAAVLEAVKKGNIKNFDTRSKI